MDARNITIAQSTSSPIAWLFLLTFSSPGSPDLCLVNNNESIVSNGITYSAYPFNLNLPEDTGDRLPVVTLTIDNISGEIIKLVREMKDAPTVKLQLITSAYPDIVEKQLDFMQLRAVNYDQLVIQGSLSIQNVLTAKFPSESYTPVTFPGLFR